jgi:hypothetical protein
MTIIDALSNKLRQTRSDNKPLIDKYNLVRGYTSDIVSAFQCFNLLERNSYGAYGLGNSSKSSLLDALAYLIYLCDLIIDISRNGLDSKSAVQLFYAALRLFLETIKDTKLYKVLKPILDAIIYDAIGWQNVLRCASDALDIGIPGMINKSPRDLLPDIEKRLGMGGDSVISKYKGLSESTKTNNYESIATKFEGIKSVLQGANSIAMISNFENPIKNITSKSTSNGLIKQVKKMAGERIG